MAEINPRCHRVTHQARHQKVTQSLSHIGCPTRYPSANISLGRGWCAEPGGGYDIAGIGGGESTLQLILRQKVVSLYWRSDTHTHTQMGILTFGYAVRFNLWYENFISGLGSCENWPLCSWLIVELLSLLWVKNYRWSHWKPFLWPTVFHWAVMFYGQAFSFGNIMWQCSWKNIHGGH
jgi:hypothetical protein